MTITVDAEGFTRGFEVGRRSYRELQHPALSFSLGKVVHIMPEDAWRITQEGTRREETEAMAGGTILDSLLTGPSYNRQDGDHGQTEYIYKSGKQKGEVSVTTWHDWNGLRIVACDDFGSKSAQLAKQDGKALGLTVISADDFAAEEKLAYELRVRMELAGFQIENYMPQVSLYWTETAKNGRVIQCRGRLDFLSHDWTSIVDLKRVEDLSHQSLERAVDRYRWAMQAAAYSRAVMHLRLVLGAALPDPDVLDELDSPPSWRWLFARTSPVVACTLRPADSMLLEAGEAAWNRAVNDWAEGLATGMWRGHESDHTPLMPTSWAVEQMEADLV